MAEAIVEQLETVQVDMHQSDAAAALAGALAGIVQTLLEQAAVGQAGQIVVMRQVAQALLGLAPRTEIGEEADDMAGPPRYIAHQVELQPLRVKLAALARLDQLALPGAGAVQFLADHLVLPAHLAVADQAGHRAPDHFLTAVSGHRAERTVDRQHTVVGVENEDAFAGRFEHGRGQALLLLLLTPRADIAPRAEHAPYTAGGVALDRTATVLDPDPVTIDMAHAVLDLIILAAPLEVPDQRPAQPWQIIRMQTRGEVAQHHLHLLRLQTKQLAQVRMVHLIAFQIPVPQPQLTGLQRQGQALLTRAQGMSRLVQLQGTLGHAHFQRTMGTAQLTFGATALLNLARQLFVEPFGALLGALQVADQRQVMEPLQQAALYQAIDLPGHDQQGKKQDQPKQPPTALQAVVGQQQIGHRRQQAGQGEAEKGRQADGIGHAG